MEKREKCGLAWETRLRFSWLNGAESSEYGEKQNSSKLELRARFFF